MTFYLFMHARKTGQWVRFSQNISSTKTRIILVPLYQMRYFFCKVIYLFNYSRRSNRGTTTRIIKIIKFGIPETRIRMAKDSSIGGRTYLSPIDLPIWPGELISNSTQQNLSQTARKVVTK